MTNPTAALDAALAALHDEWSAALPAHAGDSPPSMTTDASWGPPTMTDAGLVRAMQAAAQLRREAATVLAGLAAEVAQRSRGGYGTEGLAKQHGHRNAIQLVAAVTAESLADAGRLVRVGESARPRASITGERLPAKRPQVAAALASASISIDAADAIATMLDRVAIRTSTDRLDAYEAELTRFAIGTPLSILTRAVRAAEARLDPDGVEPREEHLLAQRSVTITEDASGMVLIRARLDPVTAAPVKAALETIVTEVLARRRAHPNDGAGPMLADERSIPQLPADALADECGPVLADERSIPQLQADALADLARHALGCSSMPNAAAATVVVRLDLAALTDQLGTAEVDGLDRPISAAAARRLATDADLIPVVLDGASLPLDVGRTKRFFTSAQRIALAERDGGCACCGRNIGYVQAHHIRWWHRHRGRTDLSNGVLLCSFCHHVVHREGWQIRASADAVWFIPPPHVDPEQRPRLGGRRRFELTTADAAA